MPFSRCALLHEPRFLTTYRVRKTSQSLTSALFLRLPREFLRVSESTQQVSSQKVRSTDTWGFAKGAAKFLSHVRPGFGNLPALRYQPLGRRRTFIHIAKAVWDSAHDADDFYRLRWKWNIEPFIELNDRNTVQHKVSFD